MLIKKLFRDIWQNFSQFLAIFLMIFLGVFVYVGIGSEIEGMNINSKNFYKETNMPDLWAYGMFEESEKLDSAKAINRKLTINGNIKNKDNTDLEINFINNDKVSKLYVIAGEKFAYDVDKVWIDSKLAQYLNYKVGDKITIKFNNVEVTKKIAGLVMNPEHVYAVKDSSQVFPSHDDYGYVYMSSKYYPGKIDYNYLLIDTDNIAKTKNEVEGLSKVISVTGRDANTSYATFKTEIDSHKTYAGIFPFIFLSIAILTVITTLNRIVKKQRMEIGTLKALGFKKQKIIFHYTMYGFITAFFAAITGFVMGPLLLGNYILFLENSYFELPYLSAKIDFIHLIVSLMIIIIVAIFSYLSCYKELEGSTAETLRPKVLKKVKHTLIEKSPFWHKLSFKTKWNLRDIFRNKVRSFMAIIGVAGCTMLSVCAFGMLNTLDNFISWQYDDIYQFKNQIIFNTDNKQHLINDYDLGTTSSLPVEVKGFTSTLTIDDSKKLITYTDHNKKKISIPNNGLMISEKLADRLNVKVGDNITFKIYGMGDLTLKIKKINRAPSTQNMTITREYFESLGYVYNPSTGYSNKKIDSKAGIVSSKDELRDNSSKMLGTMSSVIVIIIFVALILEIVVIYNLGILSYTEKQRELATLKVLGFKDKKVGKVLKQQNLWLTIVGIILGLPLGQKLTEVIFSSVMGYSFDIMPVVNIYSYVISVIFTLIGTVIVNAILSKKVKKIDMVSSLKSNE